VVGDYARNARRAAESLSAKSNSPQLTAHGSICSSMAIAGCWLLWIRTGNRIGGTLVPTGWRSIATMPLWTVEIYYTTWRKRREKMREGRALLERLRGLAQTVPPGADPALVQELRDMITEMEKVDAEQ